MKTFKGLLAVGLMTGFAAGAQAQDYSWYLGAEAGVNMMIDNETDLSGTLGGTSYDGFGVGDMEGDLGWGVVGQVGVPLSPWFRVEGELGWRTSSIDSIGVLNQDADIDVFSYMVNGYLDIPTGSALTPYVGLGVGGATVWYDGTANTSAGNTGGVDDADMVFAYQGIAGLAYRLSDAVSIKADYRYFNALGAEFETNGGQTIEADYSTHTVMLGFTYHFGTAAPAPAPVAAPAPAPAPAPRNFMVFFDWDKSDLTPEAQAILRQAAAYIKQGGVTRITLTGHADRSGTDAYNVRLSQRRGDNVQRYLVGLGVGSDTMRIVAKGESTPLVPTADGVREAQNRRVEIVM